MDWTREKNGVSETGEEAPATVYSKYSATRARQTDKVEETI